MNVSIINDSEKEKLKALIPEEILSDDCFILGAVDERDELNGVLVLKQVSHHVWDIPFIYVTDFLRKRGIGHDMLISAKALARSIAVSSFTLSFIEDRASAPLGSFLKNEGFFEIESSKLYHTRLSAALGDISSKKQFSSIPYNTVVPLSSLTAAKWKQVTDACMSLTRAPENDSYFPIPHDRSYYNGEFSCVAVKEDQTPIGVLLCSTDDEILNIDYLISLDPGNPMVSAMLIKKLCTKASAGIVDFELHFHAYNPRILKIADYLLDGHYLLTGRHVVMMLRL